MSEHFKFKVGDIVVDNFTTTQSWEIVEINPDDYEPYVAIFRNTDTGSEKRKRYEKFVMEHDSRVSTPLEKLL